MNTRKIISSLGKVLKVEAVLMCLALLVALYYRESSWTAFAIAIGIMLLVGTIADYKKPEDGDIREGEGFVIVSFAWILCSIFGALPFLSADRSLLY